LEFPFTIYLCSLGESVHLENPFPPIFRSLTLFPNLFPRRFCSLLPFVPFQYLFTHILCSLAASAHSLPLFPSKGCALCSPVPFRCLLALAPVPSSILFTHISCSLRTIVHWSRICSLLLLSFLTACSLLFLVPSCRQFTFMPCSLGSSVHFRALCPFPSCSSHHCALFPGTFAHCEKLFPFLPCSPVLAVPYLNLLSRLRSSLHFTFCLLAAPYKSESLSAHGSYRIPDPFPFRPASRSRSPPDPRPLRSRFPSAANSLTPLS